MEKNSNSYNTYKRGPLFWIILPAIILAGLSFLLRLKALQQTAFVTGWDGYYYLAQIKSYLENGQLGITDVSIFYPFLLLVKMIVGDYVFAYKVSAAMLSGFFIALSYFLAKQWSQSFFIGLFIACFFLFSPHLTYVAAQHPKDLLGLCFFLAFLLTLKNAHWGLVLILLILNFFVHRMTIGLSLFFGAVYFLLSSLSNKQVEFKRNPVIILFVSAMVLLAIGVSIPGLLSFADLGRFKGEFAIIPHFAPISFISEFGLDRLSIFWLLELILTAALFVLVIPVLLRSPERNLILALFLVCCLLIFPFLKWELQSIAHRFYLVFVLLAPFFIPLVTHEEEARKNKIFISVLAIAFMIGSIFTYASYEAKLHNPDYERYGKVVSAATTYLNDKSPDLVITHQSLAHYFSFQSGINTNANTLKTKVDSTKIWRMATGIRHSLLEQYLNPAEFKNTHKLNSSYFLIMETSWQKLLTQARENEDQVLLELLEKKK